MRHPIKTIVISIAALSTSLESFSLTNMNITISNELANVQLRNCRFNTNGSLNMTKDGKFKSDGLAARVAGRKRTSKKIPTNTGGLKKLEIFHSIKNPTDKNYNELIETMMKYSKEIKSEIPVEVITDDSSELTIFATTNVPISQHGSFTTAYRNVVTGGQPYTGQMVECDLYLYEATSSDYNLVGTLGVAPDNTLAINSYKIPYGQGDILESNKEILGKVFINDYSQPGIKFKDVHVKLEAHKKIQ